MAAHTSSHKSSSVDGSILNVLMLFPEPVLIDNHDLRQLALFRF
jgi:hypothetical protein